MKQIIILIKYYMKQKSMEIDNEQNLDGKIFMICIDIQQN